MPLADRRDVLRYPKSLALIAGLLSAAGFAPLHFWPLTLLMLALLMHLVAQAPSLRGALARGYWFGVGQFTVGLNWIAHAFTYQDKMPAELGYGAVVALALYLAVYPAAAAGLAWRWGAERSPAKAGVQPEQVDSGPTSGRVVSQTTLGRVGRAQPDVPSRGHIRFTLIFAAAWIVTEWLRATVFTGFAWNPLGAVWASSGLFPGATRWIGTYGLAGLAILIAGFFHGDLNARRWWNGSILLFILIVLAATENRGVAPPATAPTGPLIHVVQPNIPQEEKNIRELEARQFAILARLTGPPTPEPRLILWPEAAVPDFLEEDPAARARVAALLGPRDMLMTGGVALVGDSNRKVIAARNSLFGVAPDGGLTGRYDKAHLVPYGEYLPMRPILSAIGLSRLVPGDLDFLPGPGPQSMAIPGFGRVGVQICYEIIFSGEVIDAANRPDFLFNPSNDAWFGSWGPPQHLAQARLRAIEEGIPVVRSTPTGISAVIDTDGRLLASIPYETAGAISMRLPAARAPTPFARFGNLLPIAFALFLAGLAVAIGRRAR